MEAAAEGERPGSEAEARRWAKAMMSWVPCEDQVSSIDGTYQYIRLVARTRLAMLTSWAQAKGGFQRAHSWGHHCLGLLTVECPTNTTFFFPITPTKYPTSLATSSASLRILPHPHPL